MSRLLAADTEASTPQALLEIIGTHMAHRYLTGWDSMVDDLNRINYKNPYLPVECHLTVFRRLHDGERRNFDFNTGDGDQLVQEIGCKIDSKMTDERLFEALKRSNAKASQEVT